MIEVKNLVKKFGDITAVDSISFAVEVTPEVNVAEVRFYDGSNLLNTLKRPYAVTLVNVKPGTHFFKFNVTGPDGETTSEVVRVTVKSTWSGFFKNFFGAIKGFFTSLF